MAGLFGLGGRDRPDITQTFRQRKGVPVGSKGLTLKRHIDATLGQGRVSDAVHLPPGQDCNDWLAVNVVDFYNALCVLYGTLEEFCTAATCPVMSAGPKFEYLWADGRGGTQRLPAHQYTASLFDWIEAQIDDPRVFPQQSSQPFPPDFRETVRVMCKRMFRVYAHIYHSHFRHVCALQEEAHLNTCFKHFTFFTQAFDLIDARELTPLSELIAQMQA